MLQAAASFQNTGRGGEPTVAWVGRGWQSKQPMPHTDPYSSWAFSPPTSSPPKEGGGLCPHLLLTKHSPQSTVHQGPKEEEGYGGTSSSPPPPREAMPQHTDTAQHPAAERELP